MLDYTDPAWDEYLSTGEDPTGEELEGYEEETCEQEQVCEDESPRSRVTPECITSLGEGEVFVFGSVCKVRGYVKNFGVTNNNAVLFK